MKINKRAFTFVLSTIFCVSIFAQEQSVVRKTSSTQEKSKAETSVEQEYLSDVEGVVSINTKPGADIAELIGKKNWGRGLKITVDNENAVTIDCNITVSYGQNIVTIANAVQAAIMNAINSLVAINIAAVNVNVCGIIRQ